VRWIEEKAEFETLLRSAYTCIYIDSGRETTALRKLTFDDANIVTLPFRQLLNVLMERSADDKVTYEVLRPDPVYYFRHFFQKCPVIEIRREDPPEDYFRVLNEDPGNSPVDAIGSIGQTLSSLQPRTSGSFTLCATAATAADIFGLRSHG
jgi:hypothetical protein